MGTNNGLYRWYQQEIESIKGAEGQVYSIQNMAGRTLIGHHLGTFEYENQK